MKATHNETFDKLNRETARVPWRELSPFYQQGAVLVVAPSMDLVAVATSVAADDTEQVAAWLADGALQRAQVIHHSEWTQQDAELWAVVVAPWVLVQRPQGEE